VPSCRSRSRRERAFDGGQVRTRRCASPCAAWPWQRQPSPSAAALGHVATMMPIANMDWPERRPSAVPTAKKQHAQCRREHRDQSRQPGDLRCTATGFATVCVRCAILPTPCAFRPRTRRRAPRRKPATCRRAQVFACSGSRRPCTPGARLASDSPVRLARLTRRPNASTTRQSAGRVAPSRTPRRRHQRVDRERRSTPSA